jgi:hypothetical protein
MFACKTLINSSISEIVKWTLIDTTSDSNVHPNGYVRIKKALNRLLKFTYFILFHKYQVILIFSADGWSFWEKGTMSLLAKFLTSSKVIFAPRSGFILNDIKNNVVLRTFIKVTFQKVDVVICQSLYWKTVFENLCGIKTQTDFAIIENLFDFDKYSNLPLKPVDNR